MKFIFILVIIFLSYSFSLQSLRRHRHNKPEKQYQYGYKATMIGPKILSHDPQETQTQDAAPGWGPRTTNYGVYVPIRWGEKRGWAKP